MLYPVNSYRKIRNKLTTWTSTKGFENRESVEVQLVLTHKVKQRQPVEYAELTSNQQTAPHKTHTKNEIQILWGTQPSQSTKAEGHRGDIHTNNMASSQNNNRWKS